MSETSKRIIREVKPIFSLDRSEAKRRVLGLYKAWFRQIPIIVRQYDIEFSEKVCKKKLREEFYKYKKIEDIRVIDMLVIRGQISLQEAAEFWITKRGIAEYLTDIKETKSRCFIENFLSGND